MVCSNHIFLKYLLTAMKHSNSKTATKVVPRVDGTDPAV